LAKLSRFISRLAELALPFFKLLRKSRPFVWTDEKEEAFQELKRYLTSSSVMVALEPGEPLLVYFTATTEVVSMVLVAERSKPPQPQEIKEASANGSGSQDTEPAGRPGVRVPAPEGVPSS
jgi:dsDNA-binding SOS-regulon protein